MAHQVQGVFSHEVLELQEVLEAKRESRPKEDSDVEVQVEWLKRQLGPQTFRLYAYLDMTASKDERQTVECLSRLSSRTGIPVRSVSRSLARLIDAGLVENIDWGTGYREYDDQWADRFRFLQREVLGSMTDTSVLVSNAIYDRLKALPLHGGARQGAGRKPSENPKRKRKDNRDRRRVRTNANIVIHPKQWQEREEKTWDELSTVWEYEHAKGVHVPRSLREVFERDMGFPSKEASDKVADLMLSGGNQDGRPLLTIESRSLCYSPTENCVRGTASRPSPQSNKFIFNESGRLDSGMVNKVETYSTFGFPALGSQKPRAKATLVESNVESWDSREEKETVAGFRPKLVAVEKHRTVGQEVAVTLSDTLLDPDDVRIADGEDFTHIYEFARELFGAKASPELVAKVEQRRARERDPEIRRQLPRNPADLIERLMIPYPKGLRLEMSDREIAQALLRAYSSVLVKRFNKGCWINPFTIEKSKYYKKLVSAGRLMLTGGINPIAWTLFSFDVATEYAKVKVPRLTWVFSEKRMNDNYGWYTRMAPVMGHHILQQPETFIDLCREYEALKNDVYCGMSVKAAMDKHFPGDSFETWVRLAKGEIKKAQKQIDDAIAAGVCVW